MISTKNRGVLLATTMMATGTMLVPSAAHAQAAVTADDAEETSVSNLTDQNVIVVTARRREETLLDAPLAVSVIGEQELQRGGFDDITEVTKAAPGAFVEEFNDAFARVDSTPRFRGVTVLTGDRLQQTATVFLDGIYLSNGASTIALGELERVEIIKGPQSALFGRNTFAGAINYVTKDPADEFTISAAGTAQTRGEYSADVAVEGPIFPGASARLSGSYDTKDGHYDNVAVPGQRLGDEEQWTVVGTLLIEPTSNFRVKLRGSYQEIDDGPPPAALAVGIADHNFGGFLINPDGSVNMADSIVPSPGGATRTESVFRGRIPTPSAAEIGQNSGPANVAQYNGFMNDPRFSPDAAVFDFRYNPMNKDDFGLDLASLRLSANVEVGITENIDFKLLGGYNREEIGRFFDFDLSPDNSFLSFAARDIQDYTLEGKFLGNFLDGRLNVLVGASYVELDIESASGTSSFFGNPIYFNDIFRLDPFTSGAKTTGVFGSVDYQFTDQLSLTLEGRYQRDEIRDGDVNAGLPAPISPATIENFLPRVTLRYQPSDYSTFYFTYAEGNLPGGFNEQVGTLNAAQLAELEALAPDAGITFDEETLTNYEFGWKQQSPDGVWGFNLAAFYMQRTDEIFRSLEVVSEVVGSPNATRTVAFTSNGASTDIYGVEFDATVNMTRNFSMQGSFAYIDATISSFPPDGGTGDFGDIFGPNADIAGQEAPRFPPLTLSLGSTYTRDFDGFGDMFDSVFLRGDLFYTGDFYISNANVARIPDATDVNVRLGITGENADIEFFVNNLLDEDSPTSGFNFSDLSFDVRTRPGGFFDFSREGAQVGLRDKRQFGIRLAYRFR
jgi:iron complex outermembrane receptor protein